MPSTVISIKEDLINREKTFNVGNVSPALVYCGL